MSLVTCQVCSRMILCSYFLLFSDWVTDCVTTITTEPTSNLLVDAVDISWSQFTSPTDISPCRCWINDQQTGRRPSNYFGSGIQLLSTLVNTSCPRRETVRLQWRPTWWRHQDRTAGLLLLCTKMTASVVTSTSCLLHWNITGTTVSKQTAAYVIYIGCLTTCITLATLILSNS